MSKKEASLLALACTCLGIVIGFLLSLVKFGVSIGSNNTCPPKDGRPVPKPLSGSARERI